MNEEHPKPNGRIKFNPEVNLGHILQIGSLLVGMVVFAVVADRRLTTMEIRQTAFEQTLFELKAQTKKIDESQQAMLRVLDKLTFTLEAMKPKP